MRRNEPENSEPLRVLPETRHAAPKIKGPKRLDLDRMVDEGSIERFCLRFQLSPDLETFVVRRAEVNIVGRQRRTAKETDAVVESAAMACGVGRRQGKRTASATHVSVAILRVSATFRLMSVHVNALKQNAIVH